MLRPHPVEHGAGDSVSLRPDETLPLELLAADEDSKLPQSSEVGTWPWRRKLALRILAFAAPAISMPLADPLMSLVDTICIGQVCQASSGHANVLGPCA